MANGNLTFALSKLETIGAVDTWRPFFFMSLCLPPSRALEGSGKKETPLKISRLLQLEHNESMTIRGRYGRAYIEEGNEGMRGGCIPLLKAKRRRSFGA